MLDVSYFRLMLMTVSEVTPDLIVYRYNDSKILEYLQKKVAHLASEGVLDGSKTLIRGLAKDGLLEDGNEQLLEGEITPTSRIESSLTPYLVGRVRAACELLGQYLSAEMRNALFGSYE
jgi:ribonuclease H2 subunit B